MLHLML